MNVNDQIVGVIRTRMGPRGLEYLMKNEEQAGELEKQFFRVAHFSF
jgi:hypothetical protein